MAQYWQKHYLLCKEAQPTESHVEKLEDLIDKLLKRGDSFESWLDWYNPDDDFMLSGFDLDHEEEESDEGDSDSDNNVDYQEDQSTGDIESEDRSIGSSNKSRKRRADPAYYAVKIGLFDIAVKMIERGDPCERPGREGSVLELALYHEHWAVARTVLKKDKVDVTVRKGPHGTPLYIASGKVQHESLEIIRALIQKGCRADGTEDGRLGSALHAAAYSGCAPAVELLLNEGTAGVDQEGGVFGTALQAAAAQGNQNVIELLLTRGADPMVVGGVFGTAFQAELATREPGSMLQTAVQKRGVARAKRSEFCWQTAFLRLEEADRELYDEYESLLLTRIKDGLHLPRAFLRTRGHMLLAAMLKTWDLPGVHRLEFWRRYLRRRFSVQLPTQGQLDEIRIALPDFSNCSSEKEWNICHESELGSTIVLLHNSRKLYYIYKGAPYAHYYSIGG